LKPKYGERRTPKEQVTGEKQNEFSIVAQFLTSVLVKGRLISADALHTQCAFCFRVKRWQGDYLLIAKDNQATLAEDLRLFFAEPPADCRDWRSARTVDKGHGRLEIREPVGSHELNEFLGGKWAGVAQVFRLTRTVYEKGQVRKAGRLWHHQPLVGPSHSSPTPGVGSRALDDRKSAALAP
jgi:predicted transposase YbfD/YdcC